LLLLMKRVVLLVGLALAGLAASIPLAAVAPAAGEHRCQAGFRHAVIAARHRCLKAGQRCTRRHDRQYHRVGFHCHGPRLTASQANLSFPVRAAFYYPWFPETWTVRGRHVGYRPGLGYYSSSEAAVVRSHMRQLQHAGMEAAIASWWGQGTHFESFRLPLLLNTTVSLASPLKWAVYHEQEGNTDPSVAALQADLSYLAARYARHPAYARVGGRPVIFVYNANDSTCEVADRWQQAAAGRWYVVLKVFPAYTTCARQPDSWHQYAPAQPASVQVPHSYNISPGFWRADEAAPRLARDPARWRQNIQAMVASGARWQLVTSFNEWGEGTAVENAQEWASGSGYGVYLDALRAGRSISREP
jgi:Glycosyl hydrolase family 99